MSLRPHPWIFPLAAVAGGGTLFWLASAGSGVWLGPEGVVDPNPWVLGVVGLLAATLLYRLGPRQVTPLAREVTLDAIGLAVVLLDEAGRVLDLNGPAARLFGLAAPQARPGTLQQLLQHWPAVALALDPLEEGRFEAAVEEDGSTRRVGVHVRALRAGRAAWLLLIQEREEAAGFSGEQRRDGRAAFATLVGDVVHEIRNPLFSISATADALERMGAGCDVELIALMRSQVKRVSAVMQDLAEYGRIRERRIAHVDLAEIVQRAARGRERAAVEHGVAVTTSVAAGLPKAEADPETVEQILVRLLEDAIARSPDGTTVRVRLAVARDLADELAIAVDAAGSQIVQADLARAFQPFFRRREGRTGLDLAIAERLATDQGWSLRAMSGAGGGMRFELRVPASRRSVLVGGATLQGTHRAPVGGSGAP